MDWNTLATHLFGTAHGVWADGDYLQGTVLFDGQPLTVVGTTGHAPIGFALALAQARVVLDTVKLHPGRAILLLIDTQGQQLRRRDEWLGINRAMAHLGTCIDLARRSGHRVIGLVYDQALSGGFITSGLMADACYALPEAEIRVMRIPAMARVTKLPEERLAALSLTNPVFAPGVQNYVAMGGVQAVWPLAPAGLQAALREALKAVARGVPLGVASDVASGVAGGVAGGVASDVASAAPTPDRRAQDSAQRGGRLLAAAVVQRVLAAD